MPRLLFELFRESSSPYINRFLSADTIVPGYANPQNLNRYSYVTNNPLRYIDPTGHMQVQDGPQQDRFKPSVAEAYRPRPRRSGRTNRGQSEPPSGSIYASLYVLPSNAVHDAKLSTAAEESYTGWGGSGEMPYTFNPSPFDRVSGITSLASDFHNSPNSYPINIRIDWHGNDSGLSIDNVQVSNHSPTLVTLQGIQVSNGLTSTDTSGPRTAVGINGDKPGIINMSVNTTISVNRDTTLTIQLTSTGFPPNPYVHIGIPAGILPPGGCSVPVPLR